MSATHVATIRRQVPDEKSGGGGQSAERDVISEAGVYDIMSINRNLLEASQPHRRQTT